MSRVLLIAWDGADWRILDPLLEAGDLPNLQTLIGRGQRAVLRSTIPTHSWSAWPSFLTGVDPGDHGVYDILETVPGTHKQYPVTFRSIKARTFPSDLDAAGRTQLLLDIPLTFPPPAVRGGLLAGGVLPKNRTFTSPSDLPDTLRKAGLEWPINGMSWTTYRNKPDAYLDEAFDVTAKRVAASEWLMDNTDWDLMAGVGQRRPHAARALELRRAGSSGLRGEPDDAHRREGPRHLQATRRCGRRVPVAIPR